MEKGNPLKSIVSWTIGIATVAFILLLMAIIFGNLSGNTGLAQDSVTVTNETGGYINATGYTLDGASDIGATGFSITEARNSSDGEVILSGNYTVSVLGVVTNTTATVWPTAEFDYTYTRDSSSAINAENIIGNYTTGAVNTSAQFPTVGTILGVAILILILLALLVFVIAKMSGVSGKSLKGSSGGFGSDGGNFA